MKTALFSALAALLVPATALADRTDYSYGVDSIEITSPARAGAFGRLAPAPAGGRPQLQVFLPPRQQKERDR